VRWLFLIGTSFYSLLLKPNKARLAEKKKLEQIESGHDEHLNHLRMLSGLPVLCNMIWTYYAQKNKCILQLELLKDHLMSSHEDPTKKGEVDSSLRLLATLAPEWCQIKEIDGQMWLKISKNSSIFSEVRKKIQQQYDSTKLAKNYKY